MWSAKRIILNDIPLSNACILWANDTNRAAQELYNDDGQRPHSGQPMSGECRVSLGNVRPRDPCTPSVGHMRLSREVMISGACPKMPRFYKPQSVFYFYL
ncbi:hypothetical protein XENOCAPTIV_003411 [Xenoophorus captivus]|uniref:Uncharacterized protein n=1 Tax=Xenoophorus captivus TaxID=1517983 RepID=A0ABV0Q592_9TELE